MPSQPQSPFAVNELTRKLMNVQVQPNTNGLQVPTAQSSRHPSQEPVPRSPLPVRESASDQSTRVQGQTDRYAIPLKPPHDSVPPSAAGRLLHMRSFHRPRTSGGEHDRPPPMPISGAQLGRSVTSATRRHPEREELNGGLDRARSQRSHSRRPSVEAPRSARPSNEHNRPPLPPLPSGEAVATVSSVTTWQQRIFITNLQRFCQVEMHSASTANDILELLQSQGALDGSGTSMWMVWEVCQDFGMGK